jgi:deazaflavin-dependent oxidoreductase (nitroreductase family)
MSDEKKSDIGTDITLVGDEHARRYIETNGEVGYIWNGVPTLLLWTKGRKSGEERLIPIIYRQVGDKIVLIASKGGAPTHPDWFYNLRANPQVTIEVGTETFPARATIMEGAERQRLFDQMAAQMPNFAEYQRNTTRQLPVIVLERAG